MFLLFALSSLAFAKHPKTTEVVEGVAQLPEIDDGSYGLTVDEMELLGFISDNCTGLHAPHAGTCGFIMRDDGLTTVTAPPPPGPPCVPSAPTDNCTVPSTVKRLNAGNPFRTAADRLGCTERSQTVITCEVALNTDTLVSGIVLMPTLILFSNKAGADKYVERSDWTFYPNERKITPK